MVVDTLCKDSVIVGERVARRALETWRSDSMGRSYVVRRHGVELREPGLVVFCEGGVVTGGLGALSAVSKVYP